MLNIKPTIMVNGTVQGETRQNLKIPSFLPPFETPQTVYKREMSDEKIGIVVVSLFALFFVVRALV